MISNAVIGGCIVIFCIMAILIYRMSIEYFDHVYPIKYAEDVVVNVNDEKNYKVLYDVSFRGSDIQHRTDVTVDQCKTECTNNEKCGGFVYSKTDNECRLKEKQYINECNELVNSNNDTYVKKMPRSDLKCTNGCKKKVRFSMIDDGGNGYY